MEVMEVVSAGLSCNVLGLIGLRYHLNYHEVRASFPVKV
jgi:hypothetical protein